MTQIGDCQVGDHCLVDPTVILGYPGKDSLTRQRDLRHSIGASIGKNCILRSGTVVYEGAELADGVQSGHHVIFREYVKIGTGCVFGNATVVREHARLGSNVRLMENVVVSEGAWLEDDIFVGPGVVMTAGRAMTGALLASGQIDWQSAAELEGWREGEPSVRIQSRARVGSNAVLLAGISLGEDCVVAAGAVVSFDVPKGATVMGNPARLVKR